MTAAVLVAFLAAAAPTASAPKPAAKASRPQAAQPVGSAYLAPDAKVAEVDGRPVQYAEIAPALVDAIAQAEADFRTKVFDLRRGALDQLIMGRLVEAEARAQGKTVDAWMRDFLAAVPAPTEEEVKKAYEEARPTLGGATLEATRNLLTDRLQRADGQRRFDALLQELMEKHQVKVSLQAPEPFRFKVAQTGPVRGPASAPVTIIEFSDFQCPFCSRAKATIDRLLAAYEGKVRVVYRHLPLPFHANAKKAAEASMCAAEQGKFWEMHDRLFADPAKLAVADLKASAKALGLDASRFDACLDGGAKALLVDADASDAKLLGVEGTPAFFVNGIFLNGAQPYEQFKALVDRELAAGPRT